MSGHQYLQESASRFCVVHPKRVGDQYKIITLADAVAEWERLGYRVEGPFVPLADAEKLATALEEIAGLHETHKLGYCRRTAEVTESALAEFRAAHPREETTG